MTEDLGPGIRASWSPASDLHARAARPARISEPRANPLELDQVV
jgi:hypothetical protein